LVVIDSLALHPSTGSRGVVTIRFKKVDVVSLGQIGKNKSFSGQEFKQKPDFSGLFSRRFRSDISCQVVFSDDLKKGGQDAKVDAVVFQCEFEMLRYSVAGPVGQWIDRLRAIALNDGSLDSCWTDR
jgi:hypothetical protein